MQESHHPRIAEAEGRSALSGGDGRLLEAVEDVLTEHTGVTDSLGLEELLVDGVADRAQVREAGQSFGGGEVGRVVDGRLGAEGSLVLEVLLDVLTWECLYSTCRLGATPAVRTRVR